VTFQAASFAVESDRQHATSDAIAPLSFPLDPQPLDQRADEQVVRLTPKYANSARDVRVRWAFHGSPHAPVVIVQGGISADRCVASGAAGAGWWDALVGPGCAIDTNRFCVLAIDWLERADLGDALAVASADQADALAALLTALGIQDVHAFIGASYGAMVGLQFCARHPQRAHRLVAIAGAHRAHPLSVALRNLQREIVRLGERFGEPATGLDLARRLAMTTYRGEREFAERCDAAPVFDSEEGRHHFAEESWLKAAGASFVRRFSAERFLSLSESIDLHCVAPEDIHVPTTLVGISSDRVVPLADLCELQRRCGASAALHVIDSRYGHDAFLKEDAQIGALLHEALNPIGA
jgi:homoserine O-acetyltransferase